MGISSDDGVTSGGHGIWLGPGARSGVIRGNRIHGNRRDGVHSAGAPKLLVEDNDVFDNGRDGLHIEGEDALATQLLMLPRAERRRLKRLLSNAKDDDQALSILKRSAKVWAVVSGAINTGASVATIASWIVSRN